MSKKGKIITTSTSVLIAVFLAIMAFTRGTIQIWLYAAAFAIYIGINIAAFVRTGRMRRLYTHRHRPSVGSTKAQSVPAFEVPELDSGSDTVLLQHVNFRITSYLQGTFPGATFEWITADPVSVVVNGGEGRIRLAGVPDYNEAMVVFGTSGKLQFQLMRVVPLSVLQGKETEGQNRAPAALPIDVAAWYDVSGRAIMERLVCDLESRGFERLMIRENGDVCVLRNGETAVQETLANMPEQVHWPLLAKVMVKHGLATTVEDNCLAVAW